jgi:parvulin-like peptidyl-prolyl isomerase
MSTCLKIGNRLLNGDQLISALVKYKLLEPLVGQVLLDDIIQEVPISQQELFQALVGHADVEMPENFEEFVRQWCQHKGITSDYFNAVLLRELRVDKFKHLKFAHQVESEFLRSKSNFDQVEYSLIQLADLSLAQELYFQLRDDGADFANLAQHYSLGNERQTGGWIGPLAMSSLPIEIATLFRNEQVGVIYGPVPVAEHFWIVRLEKLTTARLTESTRANLINQLYDRWLQAQVRSLFATPGTIAVQPVQQEAETTRDEALIDG